MQSRAMLVDRTVGLWIVAVGWWVKPGVAGGGSHTSTDGDSEEPSLGVHMLLLYASNSCVLGLGGFLCMGVGGAGMGSAGRLEKAIAVCT